MMKPPTIGPSTADRPSTGPNAAKARGNCFREKLAMMMLMP